MPERSQVPDGFELRKDGTATLNMGGKVWRFRRPKLGEFRKLREQLAETDDQRWTVLESFKERTPERPEPTGETDGKPTYDPEAQRAYIRANNALLTEQADAVNDLYLGWLFDALSLLADHPPPPTSDWPSGSDSIETVNAFVKHWREVPLRSGGG